MYYNYIVYVYSFMYCVHVVGFCYFQKKNFFYEYTVTVIFYIIQLNCLRRKYIKLAKGVRKYIASSITRC